ncbi:MAG: nucleoside-diphosphate-sugar pyrophosphorylase [Acidithiobacillales bacterium SG8_45]|jgi:NDP-sugar pyrophosphorylase family protein|nr:MAG: nucleoside-diphosphate-sugar pyrophosphorylase [Acidithiobacillales bacterium SG8_45]
MSNRAIILAGGKGTRLLPYTTVLPKPLMPVGEFPILEVIVRQLAKHGFDRITMAVNHQAEIVRAFFQDGGKWGVRIDYSLEDKPLSTMGPIRLIRDLPDNFIVMNGDVLTDLNYRQLFDSHMERGAIFTISSYLRHQLVDYGVLDVTDGNLSGIQEKPRIEYEVSMGVYMMSKRAIEFIPNNSPYGFDHLMEDLIRAGQRINVVKHEGCWLDIGRPDDYVEAIELFEKSDDLFL